MFVAGDVVVFFFKFDTCGRRGSRIQGLGLTYNVKITKLRLL